MNVPDIIARVRHYGWDVRMNGTGPEVLKVAPEAERLPIPLVEALKRNRDAVIAWLTRCSVCGRDVGDNETRERMQDPLFCSQGGAQAYQDIDGVLHPWSARCPYKPNR